MSKPTEELETPPNPPVIEESPANPWLPSPPQVHRYQDAGAIVEAAAKRFLDTAKKAVDKFDHMNVVLGGGPLSVALCRRLREEPYLGQIPWSRVFFVFSDERCAVPDGQASQFDVVHEALLDPLEIHEHRVLRMKGEEKPADAARRYEVRLGDLFLIRPDRSFDLTVLEIGEDGGVASLYPGTAAVGETERWVAANQVPGLDEWRLTLTLPALNASRRVLFLASGAERARVVAEAFGGVAHEEPYPCERVVPRAGRREVLMDFEAASMIHDGTDS